MLSCVSKTTLGNDFNLPKWKLNPPHEMCFLFLLHPSGSPVSWRLADPWPQGLLSSRVLGQTSPRVKMETEELIGGLREGGAQLTSLQDMPVSLQKRAPSIDLCPELPGSLTMF